jgi:hypothetical protein
MRVRARLLFASFGLSPAFPFFSCRRRVRAYIFAQASACVGVVLVQQNWCMPAVPGHAFCANASGCGSFGLRALAGFRFHPRWALLALAHRHAPPFLCNSSRRTFGSIHVLMVVAGIRVCSLCFRLCSYLGVGEAVFFF